MMGKIYERGRGLGFEPGVKD